MINSVSIPTALAAVPGAINISQSFLSDKNAVELYQNAPNPFTTGTVMSFKLSEAALVTLRILDVTGREIAVPIHRETLEIGYHEILFQTSNLPSGMYFYELQAGDIRLTRRMIVE